MRFNKRVYTADSISKLEWNIKHTEPTECLDNTLEDCFVYIPKTTTLEHILESCGVTSDSDVGKMFSEPNTKTFNQAELNVYKGIISNLEHMSPSDMADIIKKLVILLLITERQNERTI